MPKKRVILELGSGNDLHGSDYTKAAVRALRDALWHNSLSIADAVGLHVDEMRVEVTMPEEFMGDVIGDLNSRRGHIEGMDNRNGTQVVSAFVPLASMFGYVTDLRSMTQGRATSSMEFSHYAEVPQSIANELVQGLLQLVGIGGGRVHPHRGDQHERDGPGRTGRDSRQECISLGRRGRRPLRCHNCRRL